MKIAAITPLKYNNQQYHIQNTVSKAPQTLQNGVYNPIYYSDYNVHISFGKRTPEDFYAQDFNRDNMPETMKKYLNARFEERSKIAPVQIMQEAFDALNNASTVDDIKKLGEPKFSKLRPANYAGATTGILKKIKDIKAMQDNPEPLSKDGSDDLTTYLVKKIYLEGKTVKEIDKDFANDINEVYELAARVPAEKAKTLGRNESAYFSHSTVYNLGIRFPEVPFWNSFIATRDDYERVRRVKTATGEFVNADSPEGKAVIQRRQQARTEKPEPHRYNFKREKIKNISDTIVNSNGETNKALKRIKHSGRDIEELTFLQKYWSQIMTLATEKVHLSEEMISFNESSNIIDKLINGAELTKREKTPFRAFWSANPWLKSEFSTAITDVIMQFTDAYGADGNNAYFKALLQDIEQIKPNREKAKLEHARIQAEYDEMAKELMPKPVIEEKPPVVQEVIKEPVEFKYIIDGHTIVTPFDIKENAIQTYKNDFCMVPRKVFDTYMRELDKIIETQENKDKFYMTACFEANPDTPHINKVLLSDEELFKVNDDLITVMETRYNPLLESTRVSFMEYGLRHGIINEEDLRHFANEDVLRIRDKIHSEVLKTGEIDSATQEIQEIFNTVNAPLSNKERISIKHELLNALKKYDAAETTAPNTSVPRMLSLLSNGMKKRDVYEKQIKNLLYREEVIDFQGPTLRYLCKKTNVNKSILQTIREHTLKNFVYLFPDMTSLIMANDAEEFTKQLSAFPEEFNAIYTLAKKALAQRILKLK